MFTKEYFAKCIVALSFFFFFKFTDFKILSPMYSHHLNSLTYHLHRIGVFCCDWSFQFLCKLGAPGVYDSGLQSSTPTVTISTLTLPRAPSSGSYTQASSGVPSSALYSSLVCTVHLISATFTVLTIILNNDNSDLPSPRPPTRSVPNHLFSLLERALNAVNFRMRIRTQHV